MHLYRRSAAVSFEAICFVSHCPEVSYLRNILYQALNPRSTMVAINTTQYWFNPSPFLARWWVVMLCSRFFLLCASAVIAQRNDLTHLIGITPCSYIHTETNENRPRSLDCTFAAVQLWDYGIVECFHSRDQWACFSTKTKENICIRIVFSSRRISWGHQRGCCFIV